ncbi:DegT/DnrJ/EryC1/StrS family aminotransferase [Alteromonadaceae bacterium BrNp21-10]|nr:DegT/DnrJ/EryC1/StrS family aminotransferase [Alteromonadaceae bacterium BrNp21-10]
MIPVTKPYLPSLDKYKHLLDGIYQRHWLTNAGPLTKELTIRLEEYLGVKNLLLVSNGTLALQVAMKALKLPEQSKIVTTPFTFVATSGAIAWEGHQTHFSDINSKSLNLCSEQLLEHHQSAEALMGVHVFGNPCDVNKLDALKHLFGNKVIYDAAHAFSVQYQGQSVLNYGDASTLSFHATKLFHTVEGGAIVFKHNDDFELAKQIINFGLDNQGQGLPEIVGINAKMSEMHAAMGLAVLDDIEFIIAKRLALIEQYKHLLAGVVEFQQWHINSQSNGAYMPVVFKDEAELLNVLTALNSESIFPRRYFYPSLNTSKAFDNGQRCPVSESIASKILCLPLYVDLEESQVKIICKLIIQNISQ